MEKEKEAMEKIKKREAAKAAKAAKPAAKKKEDAANASGEAVVDGILVSNYFVVLVVNYVAQI